MQDLDLSEKDDMELGEMSEAQNLFGFANVAVRTGNIEPLLERVRKLDRLKRIEEVKKQALIDLLGEYRLRKIRQQTRHVQMFIVKAVDEYLEK